MEGLSKRKNKTKPGNDSKSSVTNYVRGNATAVDDKSVLSHTASSKANPEDSETFETREAMMQSKLDTLKLRFDQICGTATSIDKETLKKHLGIKTSEMADAVFLAFDQNKSGNIDVEEFRKGVMSMTSDDFEERLKWAFGLADKSGDGKLTRDELKQMFLLSMTEGKVKIPEEHLALAVDTMFKEVDKDNDKHITFKELASIFEDYPQFKATFKLKQAVDMLKPIETEEEKSAQKNQTWYKRPAFEDLSLLEMIEEYKHDIVLFTIWLVANCVVFGVTFDIYASKEEKFKLLGYWMCFARAFAGVIQLNTAIILWPVSRRALTYMRSIKLLNKIIPFDSNINVHKFVGLAICFFAMGHIIAHMGDIAVICAATKEELDAAFGVKKPWTFPEDPTFWNLLGSWPGFTGLIMTVCMFTAFVFVWEKMRRANFNAFWYTHHLFGVYILVLLLHGQALWLSPHSMAWYWVVPGLCAYGLERIARSVMSEARMCDLLMAEALPGNVLHLKYKKPDGFGHGYHRAGQYVFINIPALSEFEWHPFSLTSAPDDDFLSCHISALGDWTSAAYHLMPALYKAQQKEHSEQRMSTSGVVKGLFEVINKDGVQYCTKPDRKAVLEKETAAYGGVVAAFEMDTAEDTVWLDCGNGWIPIIDEHGKYNVRQKSLANIGEVFVDGPFGAPTQSYMGYQVIMLVGAGIGITPFAGVLRHLVHFFNYHKCPDCNTVNVPHGFKLQKCHFHWITRDQKALSWFKDTVNEVLDLDSQGFIELHNHVTSINEDMNTAMLRVAEEMASRHAAKLHKSQSRVDIISGVKGTTTHFGRPPWKSIFADMERQYPGASIGVFYCGPAIVAKQLAEAGAEFTASSTVGTTFDVHKENF